VSKSYGGTKFNSARKAGVIAQKKRTADEDNSSHLIETYFSGLSIAFVGTWKSKKAADVVPRGSTIRISHNTAISTQHTQ
jgi:hypothetical protein